MPDYDEVSMAGAILTIIAGLGILMTVLGCGYLVAGNGRGVDLRGGNGP